MVERPSVIEARGCKGIVTGTSCGGGKRRWREINQSAGHASLDAAIQGVCVLSNRLHHAFRDVASQGPLAEPVLQDLELTRADPVSGGLFFVTVTVDVTVKCGFVVVK